MSAATTAAGALLDAAPRVDRPERNYRVSRCQNGHDLAFAWKGVARPACPVCGGVLGTTTRMLRAEFIVLEGEVLTLAERLPGGLPASITHALQGHARIEGRIREVEAGLADGTLETDPDGYTWLRERDAHGYRQGAGYRLEGLREAAARERETVVRFERRLAKLGGAL